MIAADTNVLIRFFIADDESQAATVRELVERCRERSEPILVTNPVLCETEWVLEGVYHASRKEIASVVQELLNTEMFVFENRRAVETALGQYRTKKAEFSDYLIGSSGFERGARTTYTYDRGLRSAENFSLLSS
jgi:predicted nucleic-acid-binding protein